MDTAVSAPKIRVNSMWRYLRHMAFRTNSESGTFSITVVTKQGDIGMLEFLQVEGERWIYLPCLEGRTEALVETLGFSPEDCADRSEGNVAIFENDRPIEIRGLNNSFRFVRISQGSFECVLAVLSTLSGFSLEQIRYMVSELTDGLKWSEILLSERLDYTQVAAQLAGTLGLGTDFIKALEPNVNLKTGKPRILRGDERKIPKSGCGIVSITTTSKGTIPGSSKHAGHLMVYKDGLVYDSAYLPAYKGHNLEELLKVRYRGWRLTRITPLSSISFPHCLQDHLQINKRGEFI